LRRRWTHRSEQLVRALELGLRGRRGALSRCGADAQRFEFGRTEQRCRRARGDRIDLGLRAIQRFGRGGNLGGEIGNPRAEFVPLVTEQRVGSQCSRQLAFRVGLRGDGARQFVLADAGVAGTILLGRLLRFKLANARLEIARCGRLRA
jgi:hypothetical protein